MYLNGVRAANAVKMNHRIIEETYVRAACSLQTYVRAECSLPASVRTRIFWGASPPGLAPPMKARSSSSSSSSPSDGNA